MNFNTYVLYSEQYNHFYKGHCQDLDKRLLQHNRGETTSTKPFNPWKLVYFESFETRNEAIKREKYFKTAAGRRFLKNKIKL